jgi:hypothetical protein
VSFRRRSSHSETTDEALEPLSDSERQWVTKHVDAARLAIQAAGIGASGELTPGALDQLWIRRTELLPENLDAASVITFGFGQLLAERLQLGWGVLDDEKGTEIAVGDAGFARGLANFVAKSGTESGFVTLAVEKMSRVVAAARGSPTPGLRIVIRGAEDQRSEPARVDPSITRIVESIPEGQVHQKVGSVSDAECDWIARHVDAARQALVGQGIEPTGRLTPKALDALWAWLIDGELEDPNAAINLVGLAFGQLLVDELQLSWAVLTDENGTEIAVRDESNFTVFPTNFVAKRYRARETGFIASAHRSIADILATLRRGETPDLIFDTGRGMSQGLD